MSDWFSGLLGGVGSLVNAGVNYWSGKEEREQMESLQREQWARDDNAMQRKVADLKAAGLSPVLAAGGGSPSSSAAIAASGVTAQFEGQRSAGRDVKGAMDVVADLLSAKRDIARSSAETARADAEKARAEAANANEDQKVLNRLVFHDDGSPFLNPEGKQYTVRQYLNVLRIQAAEAHTRNLNAGSFVDVAREALIRAGISSGEVEKAMEELRLEQARRANEYFVPWLAPGTTGGATLGSVLDVVKGLIPGVGNIPLGK